MDPLDPEGVWWGCREEGRGWKRVGFVFRERKGMADHSGGGFGLHVGGGVAVAFR